MCAYNNGRAQSARGQLEQLGGEGEGVDFQQYWVMSPELQGKLENRCAFSFCTDNSIKTLNLKRVSYTHSIVRIKFIIIINQVHMTRISKE